MPAPTWVNLESTLGCNLSCVMCGSHISGATQARGTMAPELIAQIEVEVLGSAHDLSLTVAGEPFMTPRLGTFVELADRTHTALQMNTNATLIRDSELLNRVLRSASVLKFSVDGATAETYERIRVGAEFSAVMANIALVVRRRAELPVEEQPRLVMCMVLMRSNLHELTAMVDLVSGLGLDGLELAHLTVLDEALDSESLRHQPEEADAAFERARGRADALGLRLMLPPRMDGTSQGPTAGARLKTWLQRAQTIRSPQLRRGLAAIKNRVAIARWERAAGGTVPCRFLRSGTFITVEGDVNPCPMPGRPVAGSLKDSSFSDIWNGEVLSAMRRGFIEGRPLECCAHCSQNPAGYDPADERTARPPENSLPEWFERPDAPAGVRG
jgi:MoaA/NifB/PqqE/SkfB family radical SAM enzyme